MEINNENYNKIFDSSFNSKNIQDQPDAILNTNEFVEDFLIKFNNEGHKKKDRLLRELKNSDYLIYDVEEKQFYKKIPNNLEDSSNSSNNIAGNFNTGLAGFWNVTKFNNLNVMKTVDNSNFNFNKNNQKNIFLSKGEESPKIKVKVKKVPIKIFDDHI